MRIHTFPLDHGIEQEVPCVACHAEEANGALHSIHIQWKGDTPDVPNIPDATGKWEQVNTYCTAPAPADFACRSCHSVVQTCSA